MRHSNQPDMRFAGERITIAFSSEELGRRIRLRRKEMGYTQEDVARMLSCSPRLVGEIERGRNTVGIGRILSYLHVLGADFAIMIR